MQQLLTGNLWTEIRRRSKAAKNVQAAIGYFSTDAYLRLKPGNTLVVDASDRIIRNGETSAKVLWKLHRDGVRLRHLPNLHAKVLVLDDVAVVGSANASISSATQLEEAAILTDDPRVVSQLRSFVFQLARNASILDKGRIQELLKIKVRVGKPPSGRKRKHKRVSASGQRTWIVATQDLPADAFPDEEEQVEEAVNQVAEEYPDAAPGWIRWTGRARIRQAAQNGDQFIVVGGDESGDLPYEVEPPSTLLLRQDSKKWTRFYYDSDLSHPLKPIDWKQFKALIRKAGIKYQVRPSTIRAVSLRDAMEIQRLWPRKKR